MTKEPRTEPSRVLQRVGQLLVETKDGLIFPPNAEAKIAVLVEVAARLKCEASATAALLDIVRLSMALTADGQSHASDTLRSILKSSPAALRVLSQAHIREEKRFASFLPTHDAEGGPRAPSIDTSSERGVSLRELLPCGFGRRLEPPR